MSRKAIMVVEDDEDIRSQVVQALQLEGYNVLSAENGRRALEILNSLSPENLPGCMILDLMMPEMDGKTLLNQMSRKDSGLSEIRVLIATAKGSPVNPESIPEAVERIQKPFDLDELFRAIENHCGKPS